MRRLRLLQPLLPLSPSLWLLERASGGGRVVAPWQLPAAQPPPPRVLPWALLPVPVPLASAGRARSECGECWGALGRPSAPARKRGRGATMTLLAD